MDELDTFAHVYEFVRSVPPGKVVTYGQVAGEIFAVRLSARDVGAAMAVAPKDVPWQRVVGANGYLPIAKRNPDLCLLQRRLLEAEGVAFLNDTSPRVDMRKSQWLPAGELQGSLFDATESAE